MEWTIGMWQRLHLSATLVAVFIAGALAGAAGCGSTSAPTSSTTAYTVHVDDTVPQFNGIFYAFMPGDLTVHAGATIKFPAMNRGEIHSVVFGSDVTKGLALYNTQYNPQDPYVDDTTIPYLENIPSIFGGPTGTNQAITQPCFISSGPDPIAGPNPCDDHTLVNQPDFTGTETFYGSGALPSGSDFTMKLSPSIAPGTYTYMCGNHRAGMQGHITVAAASAPAQTPAQVINAGKQQLNQRVTATLAKLDQVKQNGPPAGFTVQAGVEEGTNNAYLTADAGASQLVPQQVTIQAGGTVTWLVTGYHNLAFGAPPNASHVIIQLPDGGSTFVNPLASSPQGNLSAAALNALATGTTSYSVKVWPGPATNTLVDLGSWNGQSFLSTGIMTGFYPSEFTVKLTFTTPGTYNYECLVHYNMTGTVVVQ